jgi:phage gpG-like protein
MKVKVEITYNAGKLAKKLPDILQKYMKNFGEEVEKGSKKAIDDGLKPLSDWTVNVGRKSKGIKGTKPLFATGNLYNSIKSTSDGQFGGLQIAKYGLDHHTGYKNPWEGFRDVPKRPFIGIEKDKKVKVFNLLKKDIRKAFKK